MHIPHWLSCSLLMLAAACGGERSAGTTGENQPDAVSGNDDAAAADQPVELTDKLMEQYLAILKEAKSAADAGSMKFLTKYGWNMERWVQVSAAVASGMGSAGRAQVGDAAAKVDADFGNQIRDAEAKLATANDEEKTMLREQIEMLRNAQKELGATAATVTDLDRRNAEVLQRWLPKLQAAQDGK